MINILYEDKHILVVQKPINVPVQADDSKDIDLLTMLKQYLKEKYKKPGNVYLGLVQRLDRPVGGVMVFARTSKAANRLSEQIRTHTIEKKYYAIVVGTLNESHGEWSDYLKKDTKTNMVTVDPTGKEAVLEYNVIEQHDQYSLLDINLRTGRSHQIRVQCASRGYPLYGDQRYNRSAKVGEQIALFSYQLSFIHPITKENLTFYCQKSNEYPWNLF